MLVAPRVSLLSMQLFTATAKTAVNHLPRIVNRPEILVDRDPPGVGSFVVQAFVLLTLFLLAYYRVTKCRTYHTGVFTCLSVKVGQYANQESDECVIYINQLPSLLFAVSEITASRNLLHKPYGRQASPALALPVLLRLAFCASWEG